MKRFLRLKRFLHLFRLLSDKALGLLASGISLMFAGGVHTAFQPLPASWLGWCVWCFWLGSQLLLALTAGLIWREYFDRIALTNPR